VPTTTFLRERPQPFITAFRSERIRRGQLIERLPALHPLAALNHALTDTGKIGIDGEIRQNTNLQAFQDFRPSR
jgi:hypothetical protein